MAQRGRSRTKSEEAYRRLKRLLEKGELAAGERLTESRAARMLGLRRGPVREALLRLEAEGLLKGRGPYGGKFVEYIEDSTREEVLFRYELREVIEGAGARLAAMNMNGWQIEELRELELRMVESREGGDNEARSRATLAFYEYLMGNCGNPLLLDIWRTYRLTPMTPRSEKLAQAIASHVSEEYSAVPELPAVVDAIAAHDPEGARLIKERMIRRITEALRQVDWERE